MQPADPTSPALDRAALSRLFSLGDATLRVALCAQLRDDFTRLRSALAAESVTTIARAAHEMKGLAATVGAYRLADIAMIVDARAPAMGESARAMIIAQLCTEVDLVLAELLRSARGEAGE